MTKKDTSLILILFMLGFLTAMLMRTCHPGVIKTFPDEMDSVINSKRKEADSISREVLGRDSIISYLRVHTDTVIKNTDHYVMQYFSVTDTVMKLISCDSVIVGYERLKRDYVQNDSLHVLNEVGLKLAVNVLNGALDTLQVGYDQLSAENVQLIAKNRRLKKISVVSSSIAILAVGAFIAK